MRNRPTWLLLAGMLGTAALTSSSARAEETVWKRSGSFDEVKTAAARAQPVLDAAPTYPQTGPATDVAPSPPPASPTIIRGPACPNGNCGGAGTLPPDYAPFVEGRPVKAHPALGSYLHRFSRWFFYHEARTPCECKMRPTTFRPPLYTWFPYRPNQCSGGNGCVVVVIQQVTPEQAPATSPPSSEPKLPAPVMPKYTRTERPFIPGSSIALGELREPGESGERRVPALLPPNVPTPPAPKPVTPIAIGYNPIRMTPNVRPINSYTQPNAGQTGE